MSKEFSSYLVGIVCSVMIVGISLPVFANGTCVCSTSHAVTDDSGCTSCTQASQCPSKTCTAQVEEGGEMHIRSFPCRWRQEEKCKTTCKPRSGWMTVQECPAKAEVGQCGTYYCMMTEIGYSGPLQVTIDGRRNPKVEQKACEKD